MKEKILRIIYSHVLLVLLWLTFLLSPLLSVFRLYFVVNKAFQNFRIIGLSTLLYYFPFFNFCKISSSSRGEELPQFSLWALWTNCSSIGAHVLCYGS